MATESKEKRTPKARAEGRRRVIIEGVAPEIDGGRFSIKRTVGERVVVEADCFTDGHDQLSCVLAYRQESERGWREVAMEPLVNDRWRGEFQVTDLSAYRYTVIAWVDAFKSWRHDLARRVQESDIALALQSGAELIGKAARRARGADARWLRERAQALTSSEPLAERHKLALDKELAKYMALYPNRQLASRYGKELRVAVDDERARFSAWYELFPRSTGAGTAHGTFKDCEARLSSIAEMGFDIVYLPPIHPIGRINRKGKNNALAAGPDDYGSPWAIGAEEGGHKSIHPALGTLADFRRLVEAAEKHGIEVALDIAFQCAPDHPYVKEHPEWFRYRPDGSVQFAENPPKQYQDIYPFNFETPDWRELWDELKSVFLFWLDQGVRIFRVDNPHTKPFPFWEWLIGEIKAMRPDAIFLAEAFTRPKVMQRLAKLGFTQSYTYFTWRNTKTELTEYLTELTQTAEREYFRPNFWPNTPDILHEYLQTGGRPAFIIRLVLAATLSANYGVYSPAFELLEHVPREPGSEEYLHSEKYEIRDWDLDRGDSLKDAMTRINHIRHENPALQSNTSLAFHRADNVSLICYSKASADNLLIVVVNLDPYHTQSGWVDLDLGALALAPDEAYRVNDLFGGGRYTWHGAHNFVMLDPHVAPAHIFHIERTQP
jgi:starch synthase (maltosyl-transferring)